MDYKFLAKKALDELFEDTEMSVGEIIRTITSEKVTGLRTENRSVLTEISDESWYNKIEMLSLSAKSKDDPMTETEWKEYIK